MRFDAVLDKTVMNHEKGEIVVTMTTGKSADTVAQLAMQKAAITVTIEPRQLPMLDTKTREVE